MIPGYGFPTDPPIADGRRARLTERLDRIDAVATDTFQKLAAPVAERLDRINQCAVETEAKLRGSLNSRLDRIQRVYDKVSGKLMRRVQERLGNSYAYAAQAGAGFPSDAQVVTGLETGDYLGTMPGRFYTGADGSPGIPSSAGPVATEGSQETTDAQAGGGFASPPTYNPPRAPSPSSFDPTRPAGRFFPPVEPPTGYCGSITTGWVEHWNPDWYGGCVTGWESCTLIPQAHPPWTDTNSAPEGFPLKCQCIDGCHFGAIPGEVQVQLCCALGEELAYSPTTGQIQAFPVMIGVPPEGDWRQPIIVGCVPEKLRQLPPPGEPIGGGTITGGTGGGQCCPPPKIEFVCPKPGDLNCGPQVAHPKPKPRDPNDDVCDGIEHALDNLSFEDLNPLPAIAMAFGEIGIAGPGGQIVEAILTAVLGSKEPIIPSLINRFKKWAADFIPSLTKGINCDRDAAGKLAVVLGALNFIQQWTSLVPKPMLSDLNQAMNYACQTNLPTGTQADYAWLANEIADHVWECWQRANGNHLKQAALVRDAGRNRLGASAAATAFRRGYITRERFDKLMRMSGVINDDDKGEIWQLTEWWPAAQNTIRYMGKDAFDEAAVTKFRLMEGFPEKFSERAKHFADGAGVDEEIMRLEWASHWQTIGFNTMAASLHRLRPGVAPPGLETTAQDVRESLLQQDYPPYWVDRMIALSYRVLTRIDATRAFNIRVLDDEGLKGAFLDEGYAEKDADILVKFYKEKRRIAELKASGIPTLRTAVNMYARAEMTVGELEGIVIQVSASEEQMAAAMEAADDAKHIRRRTQGMKGIKKDYVLGLLDDGEAAALLAQFDVDSADVGPLLTEWAFDRAARGKRPSAEKLCKWYSLGLITRPEQLKALVRLGWSPQDALRITKECDYQLAEKEAKALEKAQKQAAAESKKTAAKMRAAATAANGAAANGELLPT